MKPTQTTNRQIVWEMKDAGITITFERRHRTWGGHVAGGAGRMTLALTALDQLITAHNLTRFVPCS